MFVVGDRVLNDNLSKYQYYRKKMSFFSLKIQLSFITLQREIKNTNFKLL